MDRRALVPAALGFGILSALALASAARALAQTARDVTPNDTLVSTEVAADRSVTFRIYAPKADEVALRGDLIEGFGTAPLRKDEYGVLLVALGPLAPDLYNCFFVVDGVKTADPRNPLVKQGNSSVDSIPMVPGPEAAFLEARPVPHGEIHGGGDEDSGWSTIGRAGFILDNLLAAGKALPMLIVMPNGSLLRRPWRRPQRVRPRAPRWLRHGPPRRRGSRTS